MTAAMASAARRARRARGAGARCPIASVSGSPSWATVISVPELAGSGLGVMQYLQEWVNSEFSVAIDWAAAAEAGLPELLFDGLDEVSGDRRKAMLDQIATFSLRYPMTPWLLTVRDAAALAAPTGAVLVELEPLDNHDLRAFIARYRSEELTDRFRPRSGGALADVRALNGVRLCHIGGQRRFQRAS